ncbi:MAG: hypothetical protein JW913_12270 [Chitinispirillaceae bacterium]|nr:hypothetical protein [Chitinispirillaceae bacterium]
MKMISNNFYEIFCRCLSDFNFNKKLPGLDQLATNSFGIYLAYLWAIKDIQKGKLTIYSAEHKMKSGRSHWSLLKRKKLIPASVKWYKGEFISDVFIEMNIKDLFKPLIAAEIEASPKHQTNYDWENNGYLRDFSKLLYLSVPKRLFIGCISTNELGNLEKSLSKGYKKFNATGIKIRNCSTVVVLLPTNEKHHDEIRLGSGTHDGLKFIKYGAHPCASK